MVVDGQSTQTEQNKMSEWKQCYSRYPDENFDRFGKPRYGVWAHVGLYKEYQGWAKGGKHLTFLEAQRLADKLRKCDITAYVKLMQHDQT
jgi:hypothetical protein